MKFRGGAACNAAGVARRPGDVEFTETGTERRPGEKPARVIKKTAKKFAFLVFSAY